MTLKNQLREKLYITQDGVEDVHDSLEHVTDVVENIVLHAINVVCHAMCQASLGEENVSVELSDKYSKKFYDLIFKEESDES